MSESFIDEIRKIPSLNTAIVESVVLTRADNRVEVRLITDKVYTDRDLDEAKSVARAYVPQMFSCVLHITKLTPDPEMIAQKILEILNRTNRQIASFVTDGDIAVEKREDGFFFTIKVIHSSFYTADVALEVATALKKCFCGNFEGRCVASESKLDDVVIEESHKNIEYEIPPRTFDIAEFSFLEGTTAHTKAVYIADLNFLAEEVAICGVITDIRERSVTNSKGKERQMFNFFINDTTASVRVGYFCRQKSIDKIKNLKVGDSIVLTCKTEVYNGEVRATANYIDYGKVPDGFVPEKRASKPVPKYYETVFPQPYTDFTQSDFFTDNSLPDCLKDNKFVVFDLETTGLNSSPSAGYMDRIIEIGAYKIIDGEIKECFTTFVNPCKKLSSEIINLTGIEQATVDAAPEYEKVMPDFYKFIDGCYLVGHNAANFDYKFIDYYCSKCGYMPERKVFDTIPLAQELLHLSNYKLNTVADYFHITFNHHRASDDALVTAKIFIELIKLKKSLPRLC